MEDDTLILLYFVGIILSIVNIILGITEPNDTKFLFGFVGLFFAIPFSPIAFIILINDWSS